MSDDEDAVAIAIAAHKIDIEVTTLEATGRTLKVKWNQGPPKLPVRGPFGMWIGKDKCPCCHSGNIEITTKGEEGEVEGWNRRCLNCESIWGIDAPKGDARGLVHVHTGEVMRQLINANSG